MSSNVVLRQATEKDARQYYAGRPMFSFRGYAAEMDGEIVGLCGIYYQDGIPIAFSDIRDALRPRKKTLAKACRMLQRLIDKVGRPVYAVACGTEPTAPYLLAKLGFKPTGVFGPEGETLVRE